MNVRAEFFLVVSPTGSWEIKKTDRFTLPPKHYAVKVRINVPKEAFQPRPIPTATVDVPADMTYQDVQPTIEVTE